MEFKRRRIIHPHKYDPLPVPETDIKNSACFQPFQPFSMRIVEKTTLQDPVPANSAKLLAIHAIKVTPDNERLIRTWHPALRDQNPVYVSHPQYGPEVWLVQGQCSEIKAGGRDIHPYPEDRAYLFPCGRILTPRSPWKEEYLFENGLNPRKLLSAEQLDNLRELFPQAVGARVLVSGYLVILFKCLADIQNIYETNWIMEIGGLRTIYDIFELEPSADTVMSGMLASTQAQSLNGSGCLGLRVRMANGEEAITTVTHGFVRNPHPSRVVLMFADWISTVKKALERFRRPQPQSDSYAVGVTRNILGSDNNSPIGQEVWLATEQTLIGTITHTFDEPSKFLPYPAGYKHDLSLITSAGLPQLMSPAGYPVISGWATYSAALSGSEVFAIRLNTSTGRWNAIEGSVDANAIRDSSVLGAQYLWDNTTYSQTASLLWVAKEPFTPAAGWSGSVLCLGRPTDESVLAIVFQNFEVQCLREAHPIHHSPYYAIVKGGFLLPEPIRSSKIVTENQHQERHPETYPRRSREATLDRRVFSDI